jgi:Predicted nucleic acid-binding protein, contains PIN domain
LIIVDASVLANALTDDGPVGQTSRAELARDVHWAAPEHVVVETFSAVRGRCLGGKISQQRAKDALDALAVSTIELLSIKPLLSRMWQLRENVSGYDAAYVAAAEFSGCPLVTADVRLTRTNGLRCEVRLGVPAG